MWDDWIYGLFRSGRYEVLRIAMNCSTFSPFGNGLTLAPINWQAMPKTEKKVSEQVSTNVEGLRI